jgi:hypothetical protein
MYGWMGPSAVRHKTGRATAHLFSPWTFRSWLHEIAVVRPPTGKRKDAPEHPVSLDEIALSAPDDAMDFAPLDDACEAHEEPLKQDDVEPPHPSEAEERSFHWLPST